ncbi:hypothetical protein CMUS01_13996 [Colletotrichum musicola]|uniref:Mid2 domain-containing protein n=1 Tax=Colletotrichum musicola TaxID=2175873 RepID=A0A8H6J8G7_9PEZI|nr:hypothetical protein CMUS01_13996 [Colletotrichum musicola]
MNPRSLLVVAALVLAQNVLALNRFFNPPANGLATDYTDNPVYVVGKEVTFSWETEYDQIDLVLWSDASDKLKIALYQKLRVNLASKYFAWVVSFDGFPKDSIDYGVFYLTFYPVGSGAQAAQSHYFNITKPAVTGSSSSSVSSTSATTATTSATSSASETASLAAIATSTPATDTTVQHDEGGLSAGAAAGIAVGATLGTALIVGAIGFLLWRRYLMKKNMRNQQQYQRESVAFDRATMNTAVTPITADYASTMQQYAPVGEWKSPTIAPPVELGIDRRSELSNHHD